LDAIFNLGAQTELSGHLERRTTGSGSSHEGGISLQAALKCGRLTSEHKRTHGSVGAQTSLKHTFSGGFGDGSARANVKAIVEQTRSEGVDGQRKGLTSLHADRQLAPAVHLSLDWQSKEAGTNAEPTHEDMTTCEVQASRFAGGELRATLSQGRAADGAPLRRNEFGFSRRWHSVELRLTQSSREDALRDGSATAAHIDVRMGDLPAWVSDVPVTAQVEDADKYLRPMSPAWRISDMPFAGYRLWAVRREMAEGDEPDTVGFAHRRVLADRYYVQAMFERCPAGTYGSERDRPLPLQRSFIEVGVPLSRGVRAHLGYGLQTSLAETRDRLQRAELGLWSIRQSGGAVYVDIAYESGRWEDAEVSRSSIALLYSRHVGDEDQVELKLRHTRGQGVDGAKGEDSRLAFTYKRPI
jgi:hypothetical protein